MILPSEILGTQGFIEDEQMLVEGAVELDEETGEFVIFSLDTNLYALEGSSARKILSYEHITFVPGCPPFILGIIHVRGIIESVISLRSILGLPEKSAETGMKILLVTSDTLDSGILVDAIIDVVKLPLSSIKEPLETHSELLKKVISGETFYQDRHVAILDINKLTMQLESSV